MTHTFFQHKLLDRAPSIESIHLKMASVFSFNDIAAAPQPVAEKTYKNQVLPGKIKKLYLDEATTDAYFLFEDAMKSEKVPVHKNLLAAGSDSLYAMFYRGLKTEGDANGDDVNADGATANEASASSTNTDIVKIEDVSIEAFKEFLQFFYCDQIKLTMDNIYEVVYLGKKYLVEECVNVCERFCNDKLAVDNVCVIYELAMRFDMFELQHVCEAYIAKNPSAVFQSECFIECKKSVLSRILRSNTLSCAETVVFSACMEWVKAASKQEVVTKALVTEHLGELFHEIRFGLMTIDEFATLTTSFGTIFTLEEYQDIVQTIAIKEFQPKIFKKQARHLDHQTLSTALPAFSSSDVGSSTTLCAFKFQLSDMDLRSPLEKKKGITRILSKR